jgi:hypothetical protein
LAQQVLQASLEKLLELLVLLSCLFSPDLKHCHFSQELLAL